MTRILLCLIAILVPQATRPRWREEWLAETGQIARVRGRRARLRALMGAVPDAIAMRRIDRRTGSAARRHPFRGAGGDVRYAIRSLLAAPGFSLPVAGSLSLGIASMIAAFTFINAISTLAAISDQRQFPDRLAAQGITLLGLIGLLLAATGLYAVMSYLVSLRSREIGVRLALGAAPATILRMTLREALSLAVVGTGIGTIGALVTSEIVQSQMHGVQGLDPALFAASILLLAAAMVVASALPARRATRVDPIAVLRQE